MAKFVSISGPSATGKTALIDALSTYPELSSAVFSPDMFNAVWSDLVMQGIFNSYDDIVRDSEFICIYLIRVYEYYKEYLKRYEDTDKLVFLDCSWVDLSVYGLLNMWCSHTLKDLQAEILSSIYKLHDTVDKIYLTQYDESKKASQQKFRSEFKIYSAKSNRPLELVYYDMMRSLKQSSVLPSSNITEEALFILDDLKKSGYL